MSRRNPILLCLEDDLKQAELRRDQADAEMAMIRDQIKRFTPLVRRHQKAAKGQVPIVQGNT